MQNLTTNSKLLRIFIGEADKIGHQPLYEIILSTARENGLAGCTITRGIMSYGASTRIHTAKLIEISEDLPIIVEIIDEDEKVNNFAKTVDALMEKAGCGGLVTIEKAEVLFYKTKTQ